MSFCITFELISVRDLRGLLLYVKIYLLYCATGPQSRKVEDMDCFIKPHKETLINNIDLSNLLPNLYAYRLLNKHEKEVIESKRNQQMKRTSLIEALTRRPATQVQLLCAVLKGSKNEMLADLLKSEVEEQNARRKKRRMKSCR